MDDVATSAKDDAVASVAEPDDAATSAKDDAGDED